MSVKTEILTVDRVLSIEFHIEYFKVSDDAPDDFYPKKRIKQALYVYKMTQKSVITGHRVHRDGQSWQAQGFILHKQLERFKKNPHLLSGNHFMAMTPAMVKSFQRYKYQTCKKPFDMIHQGRAKVHYVSEGGFHLFSLSGRKVK
jgi:hypothetical protein